MKLKFVRAHKPKGDATDIRAYSDGEEVTFEGAVQESYARKYIARGIAVDVTNEKKAEVKAPAAAPAVEPKAEANALYGKAMPLAADGPEKLGNEPAAPRKK